jgi:hypothetical protein
MPELPSVIRAALDAVNAGDTDAFLALFTPGTGFVNDWGDEFRGTDGIRHWSDAHLIGLHVKIEVVAFYRTGDSETVVIAQVAGDDFNGPATYTFGVDGDRLTSIHVLA